MRQEEFEAFSQKFLDAWNTQDVEKVVGVYTDDVAYLDPNTRGEVQGADALRRYLTKLFDAWDMTWSFREGYVAGADENVATVAWSATLRRAGGETEVEVEGLDLVVVEGDRIKRNEVYFDRAALAPLLAAAA
ncbi:MAG: nuclear transport factor 2 family protein [Solirubrobacterales bacterium]